MNQKQQGLGVNAALSYESIEESKRSANGPAPKFLLAHRVAHRTFTGGWHATFFARTLWSAQTATNPRADDSGLESRWPASLPASVNDPRGDRLCCACFSKDVATIVYAISPLPSAVVMACYRFLAPCAEGTLRLDRIAEDITGDMASDSPGVFKKLLTREGAPELALLAPCSAGDLDRLFGIRQGAI